MIAETQKLQFTFSESFCTLSWMHVSWKMPGVSVVMSIMSGSLNHHQHLERPQSRGLLFPLGRLTCEASVPTLKRGKKATRQCIQRGAYRRCSKLATPSAQDVQRMSFRIQRGAYIFEKKLNHWLWLCTSSNTTRVICGLIRAEVRINGGISG